MVAHAQQLLYALLVGGDLRVHVGDVLIRIARGPAARAQDVARGLLAEFAVLHQLEVGKEHALVFHRLGIRRHRTRRRAADIRMVPTRSDVEQDLAAGVIEHRGNDRHVGQVRAAVVRVIHHVGVARHHAAGVGVHDRAHRFTHGPQVHRHVRRVGDQTGLRIKNGAREIQALLDVHGIRRVLQAVAHLLGYRHEEVVEHLQHHRVRLRTDAAPIGTRLDAPDHKMILRRQFRLPAGFHHGRLVGLGDDGGARHHVAARHVFAHVQRRLAPFARAVHVDHAAGRQGAVAGPRHRRFADALAATGGFHRNGFNDEFAIGHQEGIALPIRGFEIATRLLQGGKGDFQRRIRAPVFQMQAALHADVAIRHMLAAKLAHRLPGQHIQLVLQLAHQVGVQHFFNRLLAHVGLVGQAHAIGRQHAAQRMREHRRHAQRIGHQASMLPARAAEHGQGIFRHVVAALDRDALDGFRHVADGNFQEAFG
ncbi:hypothetical protein D3C86_921150 [compost metagenome]